MMTKRLGDTARLMWLLGALRGVAVGPVLVVAAVGWIALVVFGFAGIATYFGVAQLQLSGLL